MRNPITSLKLTSAQLCALLNDLDGKMTVPVEQLRRHERIACRGIGMVITVDQNGYDSTFVIPVRNISKGGLCFLHRSMLHQKTRCHIWVRTPTKEWLKTWGTVVRSRQLENAICEIGVQFDEEVDVSCFEATGGGRTQMNADGQRD